jgi:hypothetical protein
MRAAKELPGRRVHDLEARYATPGHLLASYMDFLETISENQRRIVHITMTDGENSNDFDDFVIAVRRVHELYSSVGLGK